MIYACERGYDFHSFSASMIMNIEYEDFIAIYHDGNEDHPEYKYYKGKRQFAKAVTFNGGF